MKHGSIFIDGCSSFNSERISLPQENIVYSWSQRWWRINGAQLFKAPELWSQLTLGVPFVDVLNTMALDANLPTDTAGMERMGNPIEDPSHLIYSNTSPV